MSKKPASVENEEGGKQRPILTANPQQFADTFEPIDVEGQKETGMWVHHPGREVSQTWEPRKGKSRQNDTEILSVETPKSSVLIDSSNSSTSGDESKEDQKIKRGNIIQRGLDKVFHRNHENEDETKSCEVAADLSPHANVQAAHIKTVGVNLVVDNDLSGPLSGDGKVGGSSNEGSGAEGSNKLDVKDRAKNILKTARNSARHLKQSFSRKGSKKKKDTTEVPFESDSSDEDSFSSTGIPVSSTLISTNGTDEADIHTNDPIKPSLDIPARNSTDNIITASQGDQLLSVANP